MRGTSVADFVQRHTTWSPACSWNFINLAFLPHPNTKSSFQNSSTSPDTWPGVKEQLLHSSAASSDMDYRHSWGFL